MFDYPLSILVGQKTNSHMLRQNLFPALRARGRAEFVRQEGISLSLWTLTKSWACHETTRPQKIQFEVMALPQVIQPGLPSALPVRTRAVSYFASGLRSAHLLGTTQFVAQLRRRDGRQGSDADRAT
jgi:hypothetical protein